MASSSACPSAQHIRDWRRWRSCISNRSTSHYWIFQNLFIRCRHLKRSWWNSWASSFKRSYSFLRTVGAWAQWNTFRWMISRAIGGRRAGASLVWWSRMASPMCQVFAVWFQSSLRITLCGCIPGKYVGAMVSGAWTMSCTGSTRWCNG